MIQIDKEKCTKCRACIAACPALIIEMSGDGAVNAHPKSCISCYHCVAVCPVQAATCDEFPIEEFADLKNRKPATAAALRNLIVKRRSVREFKKKEVSRKILEEIIADAAHAPSGHNDRGVQLTVITDKPLIDKVDRRIFKTFGTIADIADTPLTRRLMKMFGGEKSADSFMQMMEDLDRFRNATEDRQLMVFRNAPALVIAHTPPGVTSAKDDCVIFMDHFNMAAEARGLGCTWIGFLVGAARLDPTLRRPLGVPKKNTIHAAMVVGWPKYKYRRAIPHNPPPVKWME